MPLNRQLKNNIHFNYLKFLTVLIVRYSYSNIMKRFLTSSVNSNKKNCLSIFSVTVVSNNDSIDDPTLVTTTDGKIDQTIKYMTDLLFSKHYLFEFDG